MIDSNGLAFGSWYIWCMITGYIVVAVKHMHLYLPLQCRPSQPLVVFSQLASKLEVRFKVIYLHGVHSQGEASK